MIAVGQLRRWTYAGTYHGNVFLVLEHRPYQIYQLSNSAVDDGWIILEDGKDPYWEIAEHIKESSDLVQDMQMSKEET